MYCDGDNRTANNSQTWWNPFLNLSEGVVEMSLPFDNFFVELVDQKKLEYAIMFNHTSGDNKVDSKLKFLFSFNVPNNIK